MCPFPSLPWTSANKAEAITGTGAEPLSGVSCDMEMDTEETLELDEFDSTLYHCSRTLTKPEQEYCQCHGRNTKLSADFEEPCPGATGRHQMAETDLQHNSHNTAQCFVPLVNNYTALNPLCWDLVKVLVKVLIHWGICFF